ncbi:hypothetical protein WDU94_012475 [Cyamophila willieti]
MSNLEFEPLQFLKAHSKDPGDLSTQIWDCFFSKNGSELVTCGGNSVCITETDSFEYEKLAIKKYYAKDPREMFLTVTETYVDNTWIVIAAGARAEIHLIDGKRNIAFLVDDFQKNTKKKCPINNILIHPDNPSIIICSLNNGSVHILDIGAPTYPNYVTELSPIHQFSIPSEIFSTIYEPESRLFLCATNKGLVGFTKDYEVVTFKLPTKSLQGTTCYDEEELVDSVQNVCNGFIAVKCALHGKIYIFNMNTITCGLRNVLSSTGSSSIQLKPAVTLNWSKTDNYFMSLSYNPYSQLLFCGDDEGCIWIYSLSPDTLYSSSSSGKILDPVHILIWPEVIDKHAVGSKKINLDVYDIVVNKVVMHPRGTYLISSTSNNYVCIWRNETLLKC